MDERQHKLLTMLAYLYHYPGTEGMGGKIGVLDGTTGYPGTRLRSPWDPLWGMGPKDRQAMFDSLVKPGLLEVYGKRDDKPCYRITASGTNLLLQLPARLIWYYTWYRWPNTGRVWHDKKYIYAVPEKFIPKLQEPPGANYGSGLIGVKYYREEMVDDDKIAAPASEA